MPFRRACHAALSSVTTLIAALCHRRASAATTGGIVKRLPRRLAQNIGFHRAHCEAQRKIFGPIRTFKVQILGMAR
jgi:hypothetical protein